MAKRKGRKTSQRTAAASKKRSAASNPATTDSTTASAGSEGTRQQPAPRSGVSKLFAREWVAPLIVLAVALLLRLINVLLMRENSPFFDAPVTDGDFYDKMAMRIAEGDWAGGKDVFFINPFYPYFLAVIYWIFGHNYLAVKLIQIALGTGSCLLVYLLGRRLFTRTSALIAAAMAAGYGIFIYYDELLLATTVSMFTFLSALHLLLRAVDRPSLLSFAGAGAFLGISFVSRPSVFPFVAAFWLVFSLRHRAKRFIVSRLAVYSLVAAAFVLPVTVRNYAVGDDLVLVSSHTGYNLYFGTNTRSGGYFGLPPEVPRTLIDSPEDQKKWFTEAAEKETGRTLKPSEVSSFWASRAWEIIFENPGEWLALGGRKLLRLVNEHEFSDNQNYYFSKQFSGLLRLPLVGFALVCPLALLGMVLAVRRFQRNGILYLYIAGYAGALVFFFVSSRYRMPLVPIFMLFAGYALTWIGEKLSARDFKPFLKAAVLLAGFTVLTFTNLPGITKDPGYIDYYNMGNKFMQKDRLDEAADAYRESIRLRKDYLSSHNNLASAYQKAGRLDEALEEWKVVQQLAERKGSELHIRRAGKRIEQIERRLK